MDTMYIQEFIGALAEGLAGPGSRLWPVYLFGALLIAFVIYKRRHIGQPFLEWLFPRSVYLHASHMVDLKIFAVNQAISVLGILNMVVVSAAIATTLPNWFGSFGGEGMQMPILTALLLLIAGDFAVYLVHRFHHENLIFWPFHALHHSAEVMTPITVYRKHPIYDLIAQLVKAVLVGTMQALVLIFFANELSLMTVAGVNAFYVAFNMAASNLRHTHIWLSFGPVLEHIFISPAQHQIHHSVDPKHHNTNYGEVFALWDWMFGTLYVPAEEEKLVFGIGDKTGQRIVQPHDSLANALMVPMRDSWKQIAKRIGLRKSAKHVAQK